MVRDCRAVSLHFTVGVGGARPAIRRLTAIKLNYIHGSNSYRAVNTLRLSYTNQSVNAVQGNNRCLFSDLHKTHKYSLCGQNVEHLNVKLAVHIVTTGLIIGKFTLVIP